MSDFDAPISATIWDAKYRLKDDTGRPVDQTVQDTWRRIANALAQAEATQIREQVADGFYEALEDWRFLTAGRITAGAGTGRRVTLSNCFTMGTIPDSMSGIFDMLKEAALTMQQGGGIGYDFSTIRPKGCFVKGVSSDASGPLSFMDVWDSMCRTIMSAGSRRGAMMATMRCDHPDIYDFVTAKQDPLKLRNFNVSVLATDEFMRAVRENSSFDLVHEHAPARGEDGGAFVTIERGGKTLYVHKTIRARDLWETIMDSTYRYAEPGVIFIDRVNADHNIGYLETIATTNPCGEKPMGPYASCLLGSINLAKFVRFPFSGKASVNKPALQEAVRQAIRMMDNVVDVGGFPLPQQEQKAKEDRQLGLGVTGLADALVMLGVVYGSKEAVAFTDDVMREIALTAYDASIELAQEKGPFPTFEADGFLRAGTFANRMLPEEMKDRIREHGIRNALLVSIAPTGTISLYAGNVSSGIEPIFAHSYTRKVLQKDGSKVEERVVDYAVKRYEDIFGIGEPLPSCFVTAQDLTPADHIAMQAAAQKWVDSSISKTVNLPESISFEDFQQVYLDAYDMGCKGCTTYRPNDVTGSVLSVEPADKPEDAPVEPKRELHLVSPEGETLYHGPVADVQGESSDDGAVETMLAVASDLEGLGRHYQARDELGLDPMPRDVSLPGVTYKLKHDPADPALYITINDVIENGVRRPFEVFINSKNVEHFAWTVGLARMISAVFRRPHDSRFVVTELKEVFDPRGGVWSRGKYVPSVLAAIGGVIEQHMKAIGYEGDDTARVSKAPEKLEEALEQQAEFDLQLKTAMESPTELEAATTPAIGKATANLCPKCMGQTAMSGGCPVCLDCGHSKCG